MLLDHYLAYHTDADEAVICTTLAAAIRCLHQGADTLVKVCPSDGIWRDVTCDEAETYYAAHGPQGSYPAAFRRYLDQDSDIGWRIAEANGEVR